MNKPVFLPQKEWSEVVKNAPLISVDLIISDYDHRILLGKRVNQPAQGYWFTPGCAIKKHESLEAAFDRCLSEELGMTSFHGRDYFPMSVYEHIYEDNFLNNEFGTHYIVLAHRLSISDVAYSKDMPPDQHSDYKWWDLDDLMNSGEVHDYVKNYFRRF